MSSTYEQLIRAARVRFGITEQPRVPTAARSQPAVPDALDSPSVTRAGSHLFVDATTHVAVVRRILIQLADARRS